MEENKKNYVPSPVTITTEEYRDLITEAAENRKEADFEKQNRWKMEAEIKELKAELAELKSENKKLINEMAKLEIEIANMEVCK